MTLMVKNNDPWILLVSIRIEHVEFLKSKEG